MKNKSFFAGLLLGTLIFGGTTAYAAGVIAHPHNPFMWMGSNGQIRLVNLKPDTYVVTGTKAPDSYILDTASQTVAVSRSDTQTLTFTNTPLLPGTTFEIYTRSGRRVDTVKTGSNGVASPSSCPRRATNP